MNVYRLKFPDAATAKPLLDGLVNVDVLGVIFNMSNPAAPVEVEGWHINIALEGELPATLAPYLIARPNFPKRIWLGE